MPLEHVNGVDLHYESTGEGVPLVLCHEFAGDLRAWEPQVRFLARRYRVVAWNYRGYPPSDVPEAPEAYSPDGFVADLLGLIDGLGLDRVHLAGLATGGNLVLNFAIAHPDRVRSLIVAGAGAGTVDRTAWLEAAGRFADDIARDGSEGIVANVADAPQRVIFRTKDPRGYREFVEGMRLLSPVGAEQVMREVLIPPCTRLRACRGDTPALHADPRDVRRPGRSRVRAEPLHPRHRSPRRARGGADVRPHAELGGAGAVQPDCGFVSRRGRCGTMGHVARMTPDPT